MSSVSRISEQLVTCPICGHKQIDEILELASMPVNVGLMCKNREEASAASCRPLLLLLCTSCGFVWNQTFDAAAVGFEPGYEISLHFSPLCEHFLEATAERLISTWDLKDKTVVEIGCGPGHFLKLLCSRGQCRGYGFDPSVEIEGTENGKDWQVQLIRDYYTDKYNHLEPDLICCRHVLHCAGSPTVFLQSLRKVIGSRKSIPLYFEVPNAEYAFDEPLRWNIMYEYASYFCAGTLRRLFTGFGFAPRRVAPCFADNQYLFIDAVSHDGHEKNDETLSDDLEFIAHARRFGILFNERIACWKSDLEHLQNKTVVGWGAGGRIICFFNVVGITDEIPMVVDINPNRQGKFLPVTGQQVIGPEELMRIKPDVIVVSNPTYLPEIHQAVREMGLTPEFKVV